MKREIYIFKTGVKVFDDHLIPIQREYYRKRNVYEAEEDIFIDIIRSIPRDGCYVDIGAAIGYYPILAKRISPQLNVYAIEPLEQHREFFVENISLNGFSQSEFTIFSEAISSSNSVVRFTNSGYGSSIYPGLIRNYSVEKLVKKILSGKVSKGMHSKSFSLVKTLTLDNLVNRIGAQADLVQMDVQGYELKVLQGASYCLEGGNIKNFIIGTHGPRIHRKCVKFLRQHKYEMKIDRAEVRGQDGIIVAQKNP